MSKLKAHGLILLATFFIAGSFLASKFIANDASPVVLTFLRFLLAALLLSPWVLSKAKLRRQIVGVLPRSSVIGFFYAGFFTLQFLALQSSAPLNISALYTLTPLVTGILAIFFFKDRMGLSRLITYGLGAVGTVLVIFDGNLERISQFSMLAGDYLFFIAVACIAMYNICLRKFYRQDSVLALTFCNLSCGAIWMALALVVMDIPIAGIHFTAQGWLSMVYLSVCATLGSSYLYQKGSVTLSSSAMSSYIYLSPGLVALLSLLAYNDAIEPLVWLGIALSVCATAVLQWLISRDKG